MIYPQHGDVNKAHTHVLTQNNKHLNFFYIGYIYLQLSILSFLNRKCDSMIDVQRSPFDRLNKGLPKIKPA